MRWRLRIARVLRRKSDGTLWAPDGACLFPLGGFNFAHVRKARLGWWMNPDERWVFCDDTQMEAHRASGETPHARG